MNIQHTSGPWEIERIYTDDEVVGSITILAADGCPVCKTNHSLISRNRPTPEIVANARLIAAAPDILEALEAIIEIGKRDLSNPKYDSYFLTAREAIEKATKKDDSKLD